MGLEMTINCESNEQFYLLSSSIYGCEDWLSND